METKTREQINAEALELAYRAYRIATELDLLPDQDSIEKALETFQHEMWQPIEFAPKRPYPSHRSENLLLRCVDFPCAEGRWYARDGEAILKDGWYILGFTSPIKVEPTHFQYLLK